ncbi:hypothetical protein EI555_017235, partial [Monodon monoceros]
IPQTLRSLGPLPSVRLALDVKVHAGSSRRQRPGHQGRSAVGAPAEPETPGPTPPEGGPKEPERLPAQGQSHLSDREEHTWRSQPRASERLYRQAAGPPPRRPSMNSDLNRKPVLPSSLRILCTRCLVLCPFSRQLGSCP